MRAVQLQGFEGIASLKVPTQRPEALNALVPELLSRVAGREVAIVADTTFPLAEAPRAFEALASRRTVGKVVLVSYGRTSRRLKSAVFSAP